MAGAVEVVVRADEVDLVSGLLWAVPVGAVAEEALDAGRVLLRADLPEGGVAAVRAVLGDRWEVRAAEVDDGTDGWRAHARVARAGRVVVRPPWVPLGPVAPDEVVVEVDPGASFGHGAHPTTRLCIDAIDRALAAAAAGATPPTVLDVGCGSGVLAVAAVLLGAASADAVDIDPEAVRATRETATRNGVADRVAARLVVPGVGLEARPAQVVVANIGAATLRSLARDLAAAVASDGVLVVSGLLDPPPDDMATAFAPLCLVDDLRLDGWAALTFRHPRPSGTE